MCVCVYVCVYIYIHIYIYCLYKPRYSVTVCTPQFVTVNRNIKGNFYSQTFMGRRVRVALYRALIFITNLFL